MNTLLLTPADLVPGETAERRSASVGGRRADHLRRELSIAAGSRIRVGVLGAGLGWGEVTSVDDDRVGVAFAVTDPPPAKLPLTLVIGLPRPKVARRLLIDAVAAGTERIVLVGTWRTPKSYWQSPLLQPDRIDEHVLQGLGFGGDCIAPRVELRPRFKPFAEDELPRVARDATAVLATPEAHTDLRPAPPGPVVLCIGPDRGFTGYEQELLRAAGCRPATLGPRTLRVHAAVHVAIGRLFREATPAAHALRVI